MIENISIINTTDPSISTAKTAEQMEIPVNGNQEVTDRISSLFQGTEHRQQYVRKGSCELVCQ